MQRHLQLQFLHVSVKFCELICYCICHFYDFSGLKNNDFSRKKKGHKPTGQLVQTARSAGYSSVSEMLNVKDSDKLGDEKVVENVGVSPNKPVALNNVC